MYRRLLVSLSLALALLAVFAGIALAQGGAKQVGVVVGLPGNKVHAEVVTVPMTATTFDALQKLAVKLVSTNGDFGPAVCSINDTGCPSTDCFCDKQHFWAFYHFDPTTSKWVAAQEGVGAYKPADGAVEGFVWSAVDASFNPTDQPPVMTMAQIKAQPAGAQTAAASSAVTTTAAPPAAMPATGGNTSPAPLAFAGILLVAAGLLVRRNLATGRAATKP
jgi:LPXTG-motif cell wall-anchored protein